jgi:hypothetical protein
MIRENSSGPIIGLQGGENKCGISGPVEVLIKTKWCRASASVVGQHFGISILVNINYKIISLSRHC